MYAIMGREALLAYFDKEWYPDNGNLSTRYCVLEVYKQINDKRRLMAGIECASRDFLFFMKNVDHPIRSKK